MTKQAKIKSGAVLVGIGFGLNLVARVIATITDRQSSVATAGFVAILMFASVVVLLFGLFRLITGALSRG